MNTHTPEHTHIQAHIQNCLFLPRHQGLRGESRGTSPNTVTSPSSLLLSCHPSTVFRNPLTTVLPSSGSTTLSPQPLLHFLLTLQKKSFPSEPFSVSLFLPPDLIPQQSTETCLFQIFILSQTTLDWQCPQPWSFFRLLCDFCTLTSSEVTLPQSHILSSSYTSVCMRARSLRALSLSLPPSLGSFVFFDTLSAAPLKRTACPLSPKGTLPHSAYPTCATGCLFPSSQRGELYWAMNPRKQREQGTWSG